MQAHRDGFRADDQWGILLTPAQERRLRRALVARFGVDVGNEAFADAAAYAWEHRERLSSMDNPVGYLFKVGLSAARPYVRWKRRTLLVGEPIELSRSVEYDRELVAHLAQLTNTQRVAVVMVHGYGATYAEVAEVLGVTVAAVNNYVRRGLARLRRDLEQFDDNS